MDLKVVSGKTIELPAEFFSGDEPTDPGTPRVDIVDPNGVVVVSNAAPVRKRKGIYLYNYAVPASAPTGTWKAVWSAMIDGSRVSASDLFEVRPAATKAPAPATPPAATPQSAAGTKRPDRPKPAAAGIVETTQAPAATQADTAGPASKPRDTPAASSAPAGTRPLPAKQLDKSKPETSQGEAGEPSAKKDRGKRGRKREVAPAAAVSTTAVDDTGAKPSRKRPRPDEPDGAEPRATLSKGKVLLILGALAIVLAAIWFSPRRQDTVQAKIDQGVAAQKAGRTAEAQKLYEEVLQNDPQNKLANYNLGVAAHAAGDTEKAETFYVKSLQSDPDFLPALFNLAILQENTGRNEESAETYRRLLEKYPDNGPAHLNYGFLLAQKLNNPEEGRAEFNKAVELDPGLAARIPADLRPAPAPAP
jgi:Tfp pilus assembly protein PilF